jgi:hypothetical protein
MPPDLRRHDKNRNRAVASFVCRTAPISTQSADFPRGESAVMASSPKSVPEAPHWRTPASSAASVSILGSPLPCRVNPKATDQDHEYKSGQNTPNHVHSASCPLSWVFISKATDYLVIESVRRDTKHRQVSTAPVPADGAGGSAVR